MFIVVVFSCVISLFGFVEFRCFCFWDFFEFGCGPFVLDLGLEWALGLGLGGCGTCAPSLSVSSPGSGQRW